MLLETLQELVHDSELFYDQLLEIGTPEPEYNIREQAFYIPVAKATYGSSKTAIIFL